ncbi:hypothetical protein [Methanogenium sp. MK-MG]|uniref:hypothetical protein n=1 Tax=Methanogenium sp. MK-MG TaxID=2599926 RepID=UPI0013EA9AFE|nr:hypothetical protein [Methanogenium sp. MK-MG]KAF1078871.1 hypothetical protein MKMG_00138 [Methanogenium sp. MK-MG]
MQTEPGTLALGRGETLFLTIAEETYQLSRDDIRTLLFYGQSVPLTRNDEEHVQPDGSVIVTAIIDGHITVHASGRSVLVATRAGHFAIPFAGFRQVARGEAVSAPLFPTMPDCMGGCL